MVASQARPLLSGHADPRLPASNEKQQGKCSYRVGYDVQFTFIVNGLWLARSLEVSAS